MAAQDSAHARLWRDYSARRFWFFAVWMGGFVALGVVMFGVLPPLPRATAGVVFVVAGVAWLLGCAATAIRWLRFPCPRCSRPFFHSHLPQWPRSRECRHCGLARGD